MGTGTATYIPYVGVWVAKYIPHVSHVPTFLTLKMVKSWAGASERGKHRIMLISRSCGELKRG